MLLRRKKKIKKKLNPTGYEDQQDIKNMHAP